MLVSIILSFLLVATLHRVAEGCSSHQPCILNIPENENNVVAADVPAGAKVYIGKVVESRYGQTNVL